MPILLQKGLKPEGILGIWEIREEEGWFLDGIPLSEEEQGQLDRIKGRRRVEYLAVRQLIHAMSGREERGALIKDAFGKPHLEASDWEISISHSGDLAAAIAATRLVGVDVQRLVPKIDRLSRKFLSSSELEFLKGVPDRIKCLHVFWGAKESLYKAYGRRELDFGQHLYIAPFEWGEGKGETLGWVKKEKHLQSFEVHYQLLAEEYMLVWVMAQSSVIPFFYR
jgi:phosphopantetheinyl transferase